MEAVLALMMSPTLTFPQAVAMRQEKLARSPRPIVCPNWHPFPPHLAALPPIAL